MSAQATPATKAAERAGIGFTVHDYGHDPTAAAYGTEAIEKLGVQPERVFKTLVTMLDGDRFVVAVVPASGTLDLKRLAAQLGAKRATMALPDDAERATGYRLGAISPLGQKRRLETVVDESACGHDTLFVSAGRRGLELELAPRDLVRLTGAVLVSLGTARPRAAAHA